MTHRRALVAALIGALAAVVGVAGAGHAYLREWRRAAAWFSLVVGAALVLLSLFSDPATVTPATVPTTVTVPLLFLLLLSIFDAYRVGRRAGARPNGPVPSPANSADSGMEPETTCPSCGRSLDPTMDFCWYCAAPVERETGERDDPATSR